MCLGVPGQVIEINHVDELIINGVVSFSGICKTINLTFLPDARVGDFVVVHVGFAISIIDEDAARRTLKDLEDLEPFLAHHEPQGADHETSQ